MLARDAGPPSEAVHERASSTARWTGTVDSSWTGFVVGEAMMDRFSAPTTGGHHQTSHEPSRRQIAPRDSVQVGAPRHPSGPLPCTHPEGWPSARFALGSSHLGFSGHRVASRNVCEGLVDAPAAAAASPRRLRDRPTTVCDPAAAVSGARWRRGRLAMPSSSAWRLARSSTSPLTISSGVHSHGRSTSVVLASSWVPRDDVLQAILR